MAKRRTKPEVDRLNAAPPAKPALTHRQWLLLKECFDKQAFVPTALQDACVVQEFLTQMLRATASESVPAPD